MSAYHLCDLGHFSPLPDLRQDGSNIGKGRKRFASGVQEDQVVVATFRQGTRGANPEGPLLQACKPSGASALARLRSPRLSSSMPAEALNGVPSAKVPTKSGR